MTDRIISMGFDHEIPFLWDLASTQTVALME